MRRVSSPHSLEVARGPQIPPQGAVTCSPREAGVLPHASHTLGVNSQQRTPASPPRDGPPAPTSRLDLAGPTALIQCHVGGREVENPSVKKMHTQVP